MHRRWMLRKEREIWTRDTLHAGCPLAPSPGAVAKSCFAPAVSDDARKKGSRDGSKQGVRVWVTAGEPEQRLARTPHMGQDRGGGSGEQGALEHLHLLGGWQWPAPTTSPCA